MKPRHAVAAMTLAVPLAVVVLVLLTTAERGWSASGTPAP